MRQSKRSANRKSVTKRSKRSSRSRKSVTKRSKRSKRSSRSKKSVTKRSKNIPKINWAGWWNRQQIPAIPAIPEPYKCTEQLSDIQAEATTELQGIIKDLEVRGRKHLADAQTRIDKGNQLLKGICENRTDYLFNEPEVARYYQDNMFALDELPNEPQEKSADVSPPNKSLKKSAGVLPDMSGALNFFV